MSNLVLRVITAVVFSAVALWMTWVGGVPFAIFACVIGAAVYYEWINLSAQHYRMMTTVIGVVCYAVLAYLLIADYAAWLLFSLVGASALLLALFSGRSAGWVAGGFLYATIPTISLALLRGDEPAGFGTIIFLYAVVWGTDIAAYFNGRALGGPKLAPRLSPNKTWSGAVGGAIAGVAGGMLVAYLAMDTTPANIIVPLLAFVLSVVSQMGDIGESWVKRHFNVKDSGRLLPGHGGFMDRVDGLVCAAVILYLVCAFCSDAQVPSNFFNLV